MKFKRKYFSKISIIGRYTHDRIFPYLELDSKMSFYKKKSIFLKWDAGLWSKIFILNCQLTDISSLTAYILSISRSFKMSPWTEMGDGRCNEAETRCGVIVIIAIVLLIIVVVFVSVFLSVFVIVVFAVGRFACVADAVQKIKNSRCAAVSAAMSTANDGSAVRFGRWWWCWRRRRRSIAIRSPAMPTTTDYPRAMILFAVLALISILLGHVDAAARTKAAEESTPSRGTTGKQREAEPVIEEVTAKQLERLLNEKDFVAVYWCKCRSPFSCFNEIFLRIYRARTVAML